MPVMATYGRFQLKRQDEDDVHRPKTLADNSLVVVGEWGSNAPISFYSVLLYGGEVWIRIRIGAGGVSWGYKIEVGVGARVRDW